MYVFEIFKDNIDLAKFEIESLLEIKIKKLNKITDNLFFTKDDFNINLVNRLAFTKNVFKVKKRTINLNNVDYNKIILNKYRIDIYNFNSYKFDNNLKSNQNNLIKEISNIIYSKLKNPVVSLKNPDNKYFVFIFDKYYLITEEIFENNENFNLRKSHNRKYNYPTSLNPKFARAMINFVCKKTFLDPFCGAGGLLIEGALMNLKVHGSDISKKMIHVAKENLNQFNLNVNLKVQDALKINKKYECVITDLPFGKNSFISKNIDLLYKDFIINSEKITDKLVIGCNADFKISNFLKNTNWKILKKFNYYVHKSMTRQIIVLLKKN